MAVTIRQIAEHCNVSHQTVSRILNGHVERFRTETCRLVQDAARELNYRPNPIGRALAGQRTQTIGVITRGLGNRSLVERVHAITHHARDAGYLTYVINLDRRIDDSEQIVQAAQDLIQRCVDGLIIHRSLPISIKARRFFAQLSVPVVYAGWGPPHGALRVRTNNQGAIERITEHLHNLGHDCAAMFISPGACDFPELKIYPFQRAFAAASMTLLLEQNPDAPPATTLERCAYEAVKRLLAANERVTALVMGNDEAAIGALAALEDAGLSVPRDMSVVGWGDLPVAEFARPSLTTVRGEGARGGFLAFELLRQRIEHPSTPAHSQTIELPLVIRRSTGPAPDKASRVPLDSPLWDCAALNLDPEIVCESQSASNDSITWKPAHMSPV